MSDSEFNYNYHLFFLTSTGSVPDNFQSQEVNEEF